MENNKMHYTTACAMIFMHFGEDAQKRKLQEECAELIGAIARNDNENMLEKMAGVLFLIEQFQSRLEYYKKIKEIKMQKVARTIDRIGQEANCIMSNKKENEMKIDLTVQNKRFQLEIVSSFNPADRLNELDEIPETPDGNIDYWQAANLLCAEDGGRLPTVEELQLIATLQKNKLINTGYTGNFWSSTLLAANTNHAWDVNFGSCGQGYGDRSDHWQVLCVR